MGVNVKICGIKSKEEIHALDVARVAYAGLWYGIPNGVHNLSIQQLVDITKVETRHITPILVTMLQDLSMIQEVIEKSGIKAIQLHGFQLPSFVSQLKKTMGEDLKVFKVLHVKDNQCLEEPIVKRYLDAGADYLLLDSFTDKLAIGSTGKPISTEFLDTFLTHYGIQDNLMIAGGLNEKNVYETAMYYQPFGLDIDSGAREAGEISAFKVQQIMAQLKPLNVERKLSS